MVEIIKVKLTQLDESPTGIRNMEAIGECTKLPVVNETFKMVGNGLEFGTRMIWTSIVQTVDKISDKIYNFQTMNTNYRLDIL